MKIIMSILLMLKADLIEQIMRRISSSAQLKTSKTRLILAFNYGISLVLEILTLKIMILKRRKKMERMVRIISY